MLVCPMSSLVNLHHLVMVVSARLLLCNSYYISICNKYLVRSDCDSLNILFHGQGPSKSPTAPLLYPIILLPCFMDALGNLKDE